MGVGVGVGAVGTCLCTVHTSIRTYVPADFVWLCYVHTHIPTSHMDTQVSYLGTYDGYSPEPHALYSAHTWVVYVMYI